MYVAPKNVCSPPKGVCSSLKVYLYENHPNIYIYIYVYIMVSTSNYMGTQEGLVNVGYVGEGSMQGCRREVELIE